MYFAGEYSKYDINDKAIYNGSVVIVVSVGVLGGKLSRHAFLYEIVDEDGKHHKATEQALNPIGNNEQDK